MYTITSSFLTSCILCFWSYGILSKSLSDTVKEIGAVEPLTLCALWTQKSPAEASTAWCHSLRPWSTQALFPGPENDRWLIQSETAETSPQVLCGSVSEVLFWGRRSVPRGRKNCAKWVNAALRGRRQTYQLSFSFSSFLLLPKKKKLNIFLEQFANCLKYFT